MTNPEFQNLVEGKGFFILDGATGSNLRAAGMPVGASTEQWVLRHPGVLMDLQRAYARAGSDVVYAPTFCANRLYLADCGLAGRVAEINRALVRLSRDAVEDRCLVGGDVTTLGRPLNREGGISYAGMLDIYREQMEALAGAGVDLIAIETMLSVDETAAALEAALSVCDLPVLCSLTLQADGSALWGGTGPEAVETLQELGAAAVGVNCSVGPDQLEAAVRNMRAVAKVPVIAKPNAGLPVIDGEGRACYSMGPVEFARHMRTLARAGASVLGGCCGTTPDYIRALRDALDIH